jgi:hypothetical protein
LIISLKFKLKNFDLWEQLDILKHGAEQVITTEANVEIEEEIELRLINFAEIMPTSADFTNHVADEVSGIETFKEDGFSGLSQDELFEKLQNYKSYSIMV